MNRVLFRSRLAKSLVALIVVLVILIVIWVIINRPSQPEPPEGLALNCEDIVERDTSQESQATPFFFRDQVILSGSPAAVASSVRLLEDEYGIQLTALTECTITFPRQLPNLYEARPFPLQTSREAEQMALPFYDQQTGNFILQNDLAMNLYQFAGEVASQEIFESLNDLKTTDPELQMVYADPNYLVGDMAKSPCGNPFGVEGSPFGVEGSPFGVEGSPDGGAGIPAQPGAFWKQWAFERIQLQELNNHRVDQTGKDVWVGIFDTSPYQLGPGNKVATITETEIAPLMEIVVHHAFELPQLSVSNSITNPIDVKDHGLFVASLVHAVAPDSGIHLYRVLNDWGCGDLFTLNVSMLDFAAQVLGENGLRQRAVINLSLGIQKPRELPTDPQERKSAEAEIERLGEDVRAAYELIQIEKSIESLELVTHIAYRAGIVVVAAAGNDSVPDHPPLPMELPAAYPFVLGIAASGPDDGPACYSNQGDVVAPGADAMRGKDSESNPICLPLAKKCPSLDSSEDPGHCDYGVVGLNSSSGYSYWVGTSFATPLASGLGALIYEKTGSPAVVYQDITTKVGSIPDPRYGSGIIRVVDALQP
jgi:hypothetical protein